MCKIIDSFLFFQELDLLEIRLEYLYPKVDKFIIIEACQTFTGLPKPFNFEKNKQRFSKYLDKIVYFKIEDSHSSYESVIQFLNSKNDPAYLKVKDIMDCHTHYPKSGLNWVLDTYHREMLHVVYSQHLSENDILFLSDLDEIPSLSVFDQLDSMDLTKPIVCEQHEFMYFLNYYNNSNWLGTIFGKYKNFTNLSLCSLRIDSKEIRHHVNEFALQAGGFHFTSIGDIETIKKKIQSWGHQEFNTKNILERLEYNIRTGQDIFEREYGTKMSKINFSNKNIYDETIASILSRYHNLITEHEIKHVYRFSPYNIYRKIINKFSKSRF